MKKLAALAVAIDVSITAMGPARGYELLAGGAQKRGQVMGTGAVTDSIQVSQSAGSVPVSLRFFDSDGVVSACPRVDVAVRAGRPSCLPRFVLTATQLGYRQFLCELTCEPLQGGLE